MEPLIIKTSIILDEEIARKFERFCQYEQIYGQIFYEILNAKPPEIVNGKIILFIKNGKWQKTQVFDEKGRI